MHTGIYPNGPMYTSKAECRTHRAVPIRTLHVSCEHSRHASRTRCAHVQELRCCGSDCGARAGRWARATRRRTRHPRCRSRCLRAGHAVSARAAAAFVGVERARGQGVRLRAELRRSRTRRTPELLWLADAQWRWRVERLRVVGLAGSRTAAMADWLLRRASAAAVSLCAGVTVAAGAAVLVASRWRQDKDLIGRLYIPYVNFCWFGTRCTPDTRQQQLWRQACSIATLGYSAHAMCAC